ncbi:ribonuclease Y [bacterium]|nr:ribonuclease Y [candidate division CSSED10-310 bacterium]
MPDLSPVILLVIIAGVALGAFFIGFIINRKVSRKVQESAEQEAQRTLTKAKRDADSIVKEAKLEAKESFFSMKSEFEKTTRERREELQAMEKRFLQREENLDRKLHLLEQKDAALNRKKAELDNRDRKVTASERQVESLLEEQQKMLERISGFSTAEAKRILMSQMEEEAKTEAAGTIKKIIENTNLEAERKAKEIVSTAIQRCASDYVAESTVSVVALPNDEMKGRIIGREGRNIRALELATGIDLIIDDTPEAVILSGFDAYRREVAATALKRLIADGRIHPARIEEIVDKVKKEMDASVREVGEQVAFETGVHGLHGDVIRLLGRLKYRYSYAQNVLQHSREVAFLCGMMAEELGVNAKMARRAGLLHDIGKAVDHEVEGNHAKIGAELLRKLNESEDVVHAVGAHHNDVTPQSIEAVLVQSADALSAARPGARREILETYIKRLQKLEAIADSFKGVDKSYAIQAGREVRIIVKPDDINDAEMLMLARDVAKKVESELEYPGEIKVTLIRETRTVEYAR